MIVSITGAKIGRMVNNTNEIKVSYTYTSAFAFAKLT